MEDEAEATDAELESGGGGGVFAPLDAEADDEAARVEVVREGDDDAVEPGADD